MPPVILTMFRGVFVLALMCFSLFALQPLFTGVAATYVGPPTYGSLHGALPRDTPVYITVFLPPRNAGELALVSEEVANRQIAPLSPSELRAEFSPSVSSFERVEAFLNSSGFTVVYASPLRLSLEAYAPASVVEKVFSTTLALYSAGGLTYYAPLSRPVAPAALSGTEVAGLSNRSVPSPYYLVLGRLHGSSVVASQLPRSVPVYSSLAFSATYYTPRVFEQAYNATPLLTKSSGQSIAVIDMYGDPEIQQDVARFDAMFSLPSANVTVVPVGVYEPEFGVFTGWDIESALDVEAAHAMAPYAKIYLVAASNPVNGLFEAVDYVVSKHLANVTSMSWGLPESLFGASGFYSFGAYNFPYTEFYFTLGTAEGMSFFASSGDLGAYGGTPTVYGGVSYPASSPFVTAVGGTTLFVNVTSGSVSAKDENVTYGAEDAWSISPQYSGETVASGGGVSTLFPSPAYQSSLGYSMRTVPDVAADANPYTGALIVSEGSTLVIGGTSLSSPLWAGMAADLAGYLNRPLGLLNTWLYALLSTSAYSSAFHEVSFGNNGFYGAKAGYNLVTGLGSPNLGNLARALSSLPRTLSVSVSAGGSGMQFPQFDYGSLVNVVALVTAPGGGRVSSGSFEASVVSQAGSVTSFPLSYNGSDWVGSFTVPAGEPPGSWLVNVQGSANGTLVGYGSTEIQVGLSVSVLEPVPYPYGPPLEPGSPFTIAAYVTYPNGTPVSVMNISALFEQNGSTVFSAPLAPVPGEPGLFAGASMLPSGAPQGVYTMVLEGSAGIQQGSAYTYEYFGELVFGATVITPLNGPIPSAAPGNNVTLLALAESASGLGVFTSNASVLFYAPSGSLVASVKLLPEPDHVQYGIYNFFFYHGANFTIPAGLAPGFYRLVFRASYAGSSSQEEGYYTTGLYIAPSASPLAEHAPSSAMEGETVRVVARIPAAQGVFTATLVPASLSFESILLEYYASVPMQYVPSLGEWAANITVPSVLQGGVFQGAAAGSLAGPWYVYVTGESGAAVNAAGPPALLNVLPYTSLPYHSLTPLNVDSAPLVSGGGGYHVLSAVGANSFSVTGLNLTLLGDRFGSLVVNNSRVYASASDFGNITAYNSTVILVSSTISDSRVGVTAYHSQVGVYSSTLDDLGYGFSPLDGSNVTLSADSYSGVASLSTLPKPSVTLLTPTVSAAGSVTLSVEGRSVRITSVEVNGVRVLPSTSYVNGSALVQIPFDGAHTPDGVYTLNVSVSDGLSYTYAFSVLNRYHEAYREAVLEAVGIAGFLLALSLIIVILVVTRRRGA